MDEVEGRTWLNNLVAREFDGTELRPRLRAETSPPKAESLRAFLTSGDEADLRRFVRVLTSDIAPTSIPIPPAPGAFRSIAIRPQSPNARVVLQVLGWAFGEAGREAIYEELSALGATSKSHRFLLAMIRADQGGNASSE